MTREPTGATYVLTWCGLAALSALTLGLSFAPLGAFATPVAIGIATAKASLIAVVFMHLVEQRAVNALVFGAALLLLVAFVFLSAADVATRDAVVVEEATPPLAAEEASASPRETR